MNGTSELQRVRRSIQADRDERLARRSGVRQPQICAIEKGREAALSTYERLFAGSGATLVFAARPSLTRERLIDNRLTAEDRRRIARQARPRRSRHS